MNPLSALASLLTTTTPQNYTISEVPDRDAALRAANVWVLADPENRSWSEILPTGSMKSKFDENSIALLQKTKGDDPSLKKGNLVRLVNDERFGKNEDGTSKNVIHEIVELNDTHMITNGVSNKHYDRWMPRTCIAYKADIVKWKPASPVK